MPTSITRFVLLAVCTTLLALAGCQGNSASQPPPTMYGRESPAIAYSRQTSEQRQIEKQREADQKRQEESQKEQRLAAAQEQLKAQNQPLAQHQPTSSPAPSSPASGTYKHVVIMWLKQHGDEASRQQLIDACATLRAIPGVLDATGGPALPSDRPVVDSSYDVAFVITFADRASLQAYPNHPAHQKVVEELIKPKVDRYVVYDFESR